MSSLRAKRAAAARDAVRGLGARSDEFDLADLDIIVHSMKRFVRSGRHADIVINSAGIMACPETRVGPGWEAQFAVNHLGHYALVNQLWAALATGGGARVVAVSSGAHGITGIRWDDLHFASRLRQVAGLRPVEDGQALFAVHLDALGRDAGVRAFSLHPGSILTPLQRHLSKDEMIAAGWIDANGDLADPTFKTPEQGAATQVWAATSPQLDGLGGLYCQDCDIAPLAEGEAPSACAPTPPTRNRPLACGNCRPNLPASTLSPDFA